MKTRIFLTLLVGIMALSCTQKKKLVYPKTEKKIVTDTFFGTEVDDPYRWLEDDRSPETEAWVKEENKVTFAYLDQISYRDALKDELTEIWNYEKLSAPFKEGEYTYYYKNDGLQNQYVMYRKKGDDGAEELFLDPNTFSEDATTSLGQVSFSKDGSIVAYAISEGGSDWRKIIIIDAETKEVLEDTLVDVKFSGISWVANDGFYYSSYDKPEGSELSAKTEQHKLYYHKLGTPQKEDKIIFGEKEKYRYIGGSVTEDDRYLIISGGISTSGNRLFLKDLTKPNSEIITIDDNIDTDSYVADNKESKLYIVTNFNA
ncbi:MAG: S9 family peptidase, partial [Clostridium sp.]|nr:S9 family peptidase [Clostridium sp.]